jgi:lipoprotein
MKKNLILGLTVLAVVGGVLTGCGNEKDVTKVDDTQAVVTESTQAALEKDLEPAVPETTEEVTEAPTEEVKADFLAENGLTVTPNGSMTIQVAKYGSDELTDLAVTTSVETVASSEDGYSDTTFTVVADKNLDNSGVSYNISAFDRYTGTSYESELTTALIGGGSSHNDVCVFDVDGQQYDCSTDVKQNGNTVTVTVHHPTSYDGVVFLIGKLTATQNNAYSTVDFSKAFTVMDYKDVFVDGQYFFTATDK